MMKKNWLFLITYSVFILCALVRDGYASETPACNTIDVDKYLENSQLASLDIVTSKSRKWAKNYFKILNNPGKNIQSARKEKFGANIKATFNNGLVCNFKARIRVNGDWKDHIENAPPLITSLDVKLLTGNINSIIKFKLFLPHTRNGDNEVLVTTLLKHSGFIAPRTFYVTTRFNDIKFRYLFQEKIVKEMIEDNQLREGPVLEADEGFMWSDDVDLDIDERFGLTRLVNKNWANKGYTSTKISRQALGILNAAYLKFLSEKYFKGDKPGEIFYHPRFLDTVILANNNEVAKNLHDEFRALLISMDATHALRPHNRNYYFDPMFNYFLPIYYDGNSKILNDSPLNLKLLDLIIDTGDVSGARSALLSMKTIDRSYLFEQLKSYGADISRNKLGKVLDHVELTLKSIAGMNSKKPFKPPVVVNNGSENGYFSKYTSKDKLLVFKGKKPLNVIVCGFSLSDCQNEEMNIDDYSRLLSGRYKNPDGKAYIFIGTDKKGYLEGFNYSSPNNENSGVINIEDGVRLISYGNLQAEVRQEDKAIIMTQQTVDDRALIVGGKLQKWSIVFHGISNKVAEDEQRFNQNLLTGCLTFLDIELDDINVSVNKAPCEDGVNFIRTTGTINSIDVTNASSDAIDIDFSKLKILDIEVTNAGNDCIDLSAGTYDILKSNLSYCGDKAISVGEGSKSRFLNVTVHKANEGITVKDSSVSEIGFASFTDVDRCLSATRKKQEYWGAKIKVDELECLSGTNFQQDGSLIEVSQ